MVELCLKLFHIIIINFSLLFVLIFVTIIVYIKDEDINNEN